MDKNRAPYDIAPAEVRELMTYGGPVVRYRTARDLLRLRGDEVERHERCMLDSPLVTTWLDRLEHVTRLHNSGNDCFENVAGKLMEFGVRAGTKSLDRSIAGFRGLLNPDSGVENGDLGRSIVAWAMANAGYTDDPTLRDYLSRRLDTLHDFAREHSYDIYMPPGSYSDIPAAFRDRPLVRPEIVSPEHFGLPFIHDMYALAHMPSGMLDAATEQKRNTVIDYILHPSYQALPQGYGIMRSGKRRYHAIGWNVDLPGYNAPTVVSGHQAAYFVQRAELMARFEHARNHPWFDRAVQHLDSFGTERATWLFPRNYLVERQTGYWVTGSHMGLEENRRSQRAIEVESTFRMLRIKRHESSMGE
jgi:hypothetical protein